MGVLEARSVRIADVTEAEFERLSVHSVELNAKAMLLTDAWGAMFVLDELTVRETATALGLSDGVSSRLYDAVRSLSEIRRRGARADSGEQVFTWHEYPAVVLLLRGHVDLGKALSWVDDETLADFVTANATLFDNVMAAQPAYARALMFSPNVAARVLDVFGGRVTPEGMLALAESRKANTAEDVEGRIGIAAQFIRAVTLVAATK